MKERKKKLFSVVTERYAEQILSWAVRKTGTRHEGEDLAQEVICQVFISIARGTEIENLEPYIWKTAHYVWCNRLRSYKREREFTSFDDQLQYGSETAGIACKVSLADELRRMRRSLAGLSKRKREIMISYYFDGLSVAQTAEKLGVTESAVKWHLFSGRKKIRKGLVEVKKNTSHLYRPGHLNVAISGNGGPNPDTRKFADSLIKQNLALLCYEKSKTLDQLVEYTGVPRPYLEPELEWLVRREFLEKKGNRYLTLFPILNRRHGQKRGEVFAGYQNEFFDPILDHLEENEKEIRRLGFHGAQFPFSRSLWALIMLFSLTIARYSPTIKEINTKERPVRPDGGRYHPLGFNCSEGQKLDPEGFEPLEGWYGINGIMTRVIPGTHNYTYWVGIHSILGGEEFDFLANPNESVHARWHNLLTGLVVSPSGDRDFEAEEKELLAEAVKNGWVKREEERLVPRFVVFSREQFASLQESIFRPVIEDLEPVIRELLDAFRKLQASELPSQVQDQKEYLAFMDFYMTILYTMMFAYERGMLAVPEDDEDKRLATLVMVYESKD